MEFRFVIGSFCSIALFMIAHLITAVWWASQITATLNSMKDTVNNLRDDIKSHDFRFYEKQEAKEQIARRDAELNQVWGTVKEIQKNFHECQVRKGVYCESSNA